MHGGQGGCRGLQTLAVTSTCLMSGIVLGTVERFLRTFLLCHLLFLTSLLTQRNKSNLFVGVPGIKNPMHLLKLLLIKDLLFCHC